MVDLINDEHARGHSTQKIPRKPLKDSHACRGVMRRADLE